MPDAGSSPLQPLESVIRGGYCVGCGACSAVAGSRLQMQLTDHGLYEPVGEDAPAGAAEVCPFLAQTNEDELGRERYGSHAAHDARIGYYRAIHAGRVVDPRRRAQSSSGGLVTWLLESLLERDMADSVIHVGAVNADGPALFGYQVSHTVAEVRSRSRSRYQVVEFSPALAYLREHPGRYVFVGVPCHVKALRLLARQDPLVGARVAFTVAIFCGHMKSVAFAQGIGWQLGIAPAELAAIDFRAKRPRPPASHYGVWVRAKDGRERRAISKDLYGSDWGLGLFKPRACDYCDDIAGETADVACGDAWLPGYVDEPGGTSIAVVRHEQIQRLLAEGAASGALQLDSLDADAVYESQAGNYRHRREGLAFRLAADDAAGTWRPRKRVAPATDHLSPRRMAIYALRARLSAMSHAAFSAARQQGRFAAFTAELAPLVDEYYRLNGRAGRQRVKALLRPLALLLSRLGWRR